MKRTMQDERFLRRSYRPAPRPQDSLLDSLGGFLFDWCRRKQEAELPGRETGGPRGVRFLPQRPPTLRAADGQRLSLGQEDREDAGMIDTRSDFDHDRQEFLLARQRLDVERSVTVLGERPGSTGSSVRRVTNSRSLHTAGDTGEDPLLLLRKSTARFSGDSSLRPLPHSFGASQFSALQQPRGSVEGLAQPQALRPSGVRRIHYYYMQLFHDALDAHPLNRASQQQQLQGALRPVARSVKQQPAFQPVSKDPCDTRRLRFTQTLIEEKEKFRKKTSMPVRPAAAANPPARLELPQQLKVKTLVMPQRQKYSFSLEEYIEKDKRQQEPPRPQPPPGLQPPARVRDPILSFGEGRSKQNSPASSTEDAPPARQPEVRREASKDLQITIPTKEEIVESEESEGHSWLPKDAANTAVRLLKAHHVEDAKTPASSPIKPKEKKRLDFVPKNSATLPDGPGPAETAPAPRPEVKPQIAILSADAAEKPKPEIPADRREDTPVVQAKPQQKPDQPTPGFPSLFSNPKPSAVLASTQPLPHATPSSDPLAGAQPTKMLNTGPPPQSTSSLFLDRKPPVADSAQASDVDAKKELLAVPQPSAEPKPDKSLPPQNNMGIDFFTSKPFEKPTAAGFFPASKPLAPAPPQTADAPKQPQQPGPDASQPRVAGKEEPAAAVQAHPPAPQPAQPKPSPFFSPLPASTSAAGKLAAAGAAPQEQPKKESQPAENPFISLTRGSTSSGSSLNNLLKENKLSSLFGATQPPPQPSSSFFSGAAKQDHEQRLGRSSMIEEEKIDASSRPAGWAAAGGGQTGRSFFGSEASNQGSSFFAGASRPGLQANFPSTSHNSFAGNQEQAASTSFFNKNAANHDSRDASNPYFRDSGAAGRGSFQQANASGSFFGAGFGGREQERSGFGGGGGSLFGTSGPNPFTPGASQRQSLFGNDDRRGGAPYLKIKRPSGQENKNRSLY